MNAMLPVSFEKAGSSTQKLNTESENVRSVTERISDG